MQLFVAVISPKDVEAPLGLRSNSSSESDLNSVETPISLFQEYLASQDAKHFTFGHRNAGLIFNQSLELHVCQRNGLYAAFAGEVLRWPGHPDLVGEAHDAFIRGDTVRDNDTEADLLLNFYESCQENECTFDKHADSTLNALASIEGPFAFLLYDSVTHTTWAARDAAGEQELWWGVSPSGEFIIGTNEASLDGLCEPTATPFPAGCLFVSHGAAELYEPGEMGFVLPALGDVHPESRLLSFMHGEGDVPHWKKIKAVPRMNAEGVLCGAVYRVASEARLHTMAH